MAEDLQIRFRHTSGDVGPFVYSDATTVQQLKEKLLADWPKEGPLSNESPASPGDLKLILSGKYVDNHRTLRDYRKDMGDPQPGSVVTMHIVIRPASNGKANGPASENDAPKGCACVVC